MGDDPRVLRLTVETPNGQVTITARVTVDRLQLTCRGSHEARQHVKGVK